MKIKLLAFAVAVCTLPACTETPVAPASQTQEEGESAPQMLVSLTTGVRLFVNTNTCGTLAAGETFCWGEGAGLGIGYEWSDVPRRFLLDKRFAQVESAGDHGCGLDTDGRAWCWGHNGEGQLGDRTTTSRPRALPVRTVLRFTAISVGSFFACGLVESGRAYCWGSNSGGQLGIGTDENRRLQPTRVATRARFTSISTGRDHACALDARGTGYCWGRNTVGELGRGFTSLKETSPAPVLVRRLSAIDAGGNYTCGMARASGLFCWGSNLSGQMGRGTVGGFQMTPAGVRESKSFTSFSAGDRHVCALDSVGIPFCWGNNSGNQLGTGYGDQLSRPAGVYGSPVLTTIGAGGEHSCGLQTDGSAICWGFESRLGTGGGSSSIPVEVLPPF